MTHRFLELGGTVTSLQNCLTGLEKTKTSVRFSARHWPTAPSQARSHHTLTAFYMEGGGESKSEKVKKVKKRFQ